jgi:hypothetical protein
MRALGYYPSEQEVRHSFADAFQQVSLVVLHLD